MYANARKVGEARQIKNNGKQLGGVWTGDDRLGILFGLNLTYLSLPPSTSTTPTATHDPFGTHKRTDSLTHSRAPSPVVIIVGGSQSFQVSLCSSQHFVPPPSSATIETRPQPRPYPARARQHLIRLIVSPDATTELAGMTVGKLLRRGKLPTCRALQGEMHDHSRQPRSKRYPKSQPSWSVEDIIMH